MLNHDKIDIEIQGDYQDYFESKNIDKLRKKLEVL